MRKVKFKRWIPVMWKNGENNCLSRPIEGTGCFESEYSNTKEKEEWIRNEVAEYDWEKCGFGDSSIEELLEKGYRKGYEDAIGKIHSKMDSIKEKVIEEYEKGNIVIDSYGELISVKLTDFIEASADEILYELNRDEATVLTFINDPKWINDFAASRVIRALKEKIDDLENYLNKIQG